MAVDDDSHGNTPHRPVAVVTAASTGIGFAVAAELYRRGYHVVISSRSESNLQRAQSQLRRLHAASAGAVTVVPCHVAHPEARLNLLQAVAAVTKSVSALVLNAAISPVVAPLVRTDDSLWDKTLDVNLTANFRLCKLFYRLLAPDSSIVFVASLAAFSPLPNLGAYSVSNTALLGLVNALASELASKDIRVNAVAPGLIRTNFSRLLWQRNPASAASISEQPDDGRAQRAAAAAAAQKQPVSRLLQPGYPTDVAPVVAFLCSSQAKYITGETIVVAGATRSRL